MVTSTSKHGTPICPCTLFLPGNLPDRSIHECILDRTDMGVPNWMTHLSVLWTLLTLPFSAANRKLLEHSSRFGTIGGGYFAIHSTKPQTIGCSLADSPVGLLAWIYEKLVGWSDNYAWTDDEGNQSPDLTCGCAF